MLGVCAQQSVESKTVHPRSDLPQEELPEAIPAHFNYLRGSTKQQFLNLYNNGIVDAQGDFCKGDPDTPLPALLDEELLVIQDDLFKTFSWPFGKGKTLTLSFGRIWQNQLEPLFRNKFGFEILNFNIIGEYVIYILFSKTNYTERVFKDLGIAHLYDPGCKKTYANIPMMMVRTAILHSGGIENFRKIVAKALTEIYLQEHLLPNSWAAEENGVYKEILEGLEKYPLINNSSNAFALFPLENPFLHWMASLYLARYHMFTCDDLCIPVGCLISDRCPDEITPKSQRKKGMQSFFHCWLDLIKAENSEKIAGKGWIKYLMLLLSGKSSAQPDLEKNLLLKVNKQTIANEIEEEAQKLKSNPTALFVFLMTVYIHELVTRERESVIDRNSFTTREVAVTEDKLPANSRREAEHSHILSGEALQKLFTQHEEYLESHLTHPALKKMLSLMKKGVSFRCITALLQLAGFLNVTQNSPPLNGVSFEIGTQDFEKPILQCSFTGQVLQIPLDIPGAMATLRALHKENKLLWDNTIKDFKSLFFHIYHPSSQPVVFEEGMFEALSLKEIEKTAEGYLNSGSLFLKFLSLQFLFRSPNVSAKTKYELAHYHFYDFRFLAKKMPIKRHFEGVMHATLPDINTSDGMSVWIKFLFQNGRGTEQIAYTHWKQIERKDISLSLELFQSLVFEQPTYASRIFSYLNRHSLLDRHKGATLHSLCTILMGLNERTVLSLEHDILIFEISAKLQALLKDEYEQDLLGIWLHQLKHFKDFSHLDPKIKKELVLRFLDILDFERPKLSENEVHVFTQGAEGIFPLIEMERTKRELLLLIVYYKGIPASAPLKEFWMAVLKKWIASEQEDNERIQACYAYGLTLGIKDPQFEQALSEHKTDALRLDIIPALTLLMQNQPNAAVLKRVAALYRKGVENKIFWENEQLLILCYLVNHTPSKNRYCIMQQTRKRGSKSRVKKEAPKLQGLLVELMDRLGSIENVNALEARVQKEILNTLLTAMEGEKIPFSKDHKLVLAGIFSTFFSLVGSLQDRKRYIKACLSYALEVKIENALLEFWTSTLKQWEPEGKVSSELERVYAESQKIGFVDSALTHSIEANSTQELRIKVVQFLQAFRKKKNPKEKEKKEAIEKLKIGLEKKFFTKEEEISFLTALFIQCHLRPDWIMKSLFACLKDPSAIPLIEQDLQERFLKALMSIMSSESVKFSKEDKKIIKTVFEQFYGLLHVPADQRKFVQACVQRNITIAASEEVKSFWLEALKSWLTESSSEARMIERCHAFGTRLGIADKDFEYQIKIAKFKSNKNNNSESFELLHELVDGYPQHVNQVTLLSLLFSFTSKNSTPLAHVLSICDALAQKEFILFDVVLRNTMNIRTINQMPEEDLTVFAWWLSTTKSFAYCRKPLLLQDCLIPTLTALTKSGSLSEEVKKSILDIAVAYFDALQTLSSQFWYDCVFNLCFYSDIRAHDLFLKIMKNNLVTDVDQIQKMYAFVIILLYEHEDERILNFLKQFHEIKKIFARGDVKRILYSYVNLSKGGCSALAKKCDVSGFVPNEENTLIINNIRKGLSKASKALEIIKKESTLEDQKEYIFALSETYVHFTILLYGTRCSNYVEEADKRLAAIIETAANFRSFISLTWSLLEIFSQNSFANFTLMDNLLERCEGFFGSGLQFNANINHMAIYLFLLNNMTPKRIMFAIRAWRADYSLKQYDNSEKEDVPKILRSWDDLLKILEHAIQSKDEKILDEGMSALIDYFGAFSGKLPTVFLTTYIPCVLEDFAPLMKAKHVNFLKNTVENAFNYKTLEVHEGKTLFSVAVHGILAMSRLDISSFRDLGMRYWLMLNLTKEFTPSYLFQLKIFYIEELLNAALEEHPHQEELFIHIHTNLQNFSSNSISEEETKEIDRLTKLLKQAKGKKD